MSCSLRGDPPNEASDGLDVFMMRHRPDAEMKEAPLEGLSVLIRGHYLCAVSGSWLVTSLWKARLAGLQPERQKGRGKKGGPRPGSRECNLQIRGRDEFLLPA